MNRFQLVLSGHWAAILMRLLLVVSFLDRRAPILLVRAAYTSVPHHPSTRTTTTTPSFTKPGRRSPRLALVFFAKQQQRPANRRKSICLLFNSDDAVSDEDAGDFVVGSDGSMENVIVPSVSESTKTMMSPKASKKEMLRFALPALGIYLANPLLSNIDNAFVGQTVGTAGLAALSPATLCTDQMLYLFSFLSRATTSIGSRAYALRDDAGSTGGDVAAARQAASARK